LEFGDRGVAQQGLIETEPTAGSAGIKRRRAAALFRELRSRLFAIAAKMWGW
jgi:hypothetical protein